MSEKMSQEPSIESFDIENSPLKDVYRLLDAKTPLELSNKYTASEQPAFKDRTWNYNDPEQIQNVVKDILEAVDENTLDEDERFWRNQILWFWYHHAISAAGWMKDKEKQKQFSEIAVSFGEEHINILTKVMHLLLHDRVEEAEEWSKSNQDDPDYETAIEMLDNYRTYGELWPDLEVK